MSMNEVATDATPTPGRPTRYANGIAARERIVAAALDVLKRKGYARASLREVAHLAGLTPAGLNHYFRTKEDLFLEVLRLRDERYADASTQAHPEPVAELLDVVSSNESEPHLVRLFVAMSAEAADAGSSISQWFSSRYARFLGDLEADVRRYQERGDIRKDLEASHIASLMVAAADGLQTQWLLDPSVNMGERLRKLWQSFQLGPPAS